MSGPDPGPPATRHPSPVAGRVWLVGAGPGDPGLITARGLEVVRGCEALVYDRLVSPALIAEAPPQAERIYVGKQPQQHTLSQEEINALLVRLCREGKRVVRLKGGDPFVFGRGGEEALALRQAGCDFEVVPGVSSALAAPAYAGIPVTQRGVVSSFTVATGHRERGAQGASAAVDWEALAGTGGTLVVLMGMEGLPGLVEGLLRSGRDAATPVALVQWGTTPRQRTVTATLGTIVEAGRAAGLTPPVVTVVGEVVRLRELLAWFDRRPLFGRRVLVTRAREQASDVSRKLADLGAEVLEFPTIATLPPPNPAALDEAAQRLGMYDWVVFTSANGVRHLMGRLRALGRDARAFGSARVCCVGPGTARELAAWGIQADEVPSQFLTEAIVRLFATKHVAGRHFLLPRADIAPERLAQGLRGLGATVDEVVAYRTTLARDANASARQRLLAGEVDVVTFTSASTVRNLLAMLEGHDWRPALQHTSNVCIGPVTAETARELGLPVAAVAQEHTIDGLIAAVVRVAGATAPVDG